MGLHVSSTMIGSPEGSWRLEIDIGDSVRVISLCRTARLRVSFVIIGSPGGSWLQEIDMGDSARVISMGIADGLDVSSCIVYVYDALTSVLVISLMVPSTETLDYRLAILHSGECLWPRPAYRWRSFSSFCVPCSCPTDLLRCFYLIGFDNVGSCHFASTDFEPDWMSLTPGLRRTFQLPPVLRQVQRQIWLVADNTFSDDMARVQCDACVNAFANEEAGGAAALSWLWMVLRSAWLSFFAMTLAAMARPLLFGAKLRGGEKNVDPILRVARSSLKGASFAFLFTAWLLPCALAAPLELQNTRRGLLGPNLVDELLEAHFAEVASGRQLLLEHTSALAEVPDFFSLPPEPGGAPDTDPPPEQVVAIRVMAFQQMDHYVQMWMTEETAAEDIQRRVATAMLHDYGVFRIYAADPQLPDDVVTVCVTPTWWEATNRVGIIFDQLESGGHPFMSVAPADCCLTDIFVAFGSIPPDGMAFYRKNDIEPLPRNERFVMEPGTVLRLRTVGLQRVELPTLGEALADLYWARDMELHGAPRPPSERSKLLIIGTESSHVIDVAEEPTVVQLHLRVCRLFEMSVERTMMVFCAQTLHNMSCAGVPHERAMALVPKDWIQCGPKRTGVFIDARELGQSFSFHIFDTDRVRILDILETIDVQVPSDLIVRLAGTDGPIADSDFHKVSQGALLTLWTEDEAQLVLDAAGDTTSSVEDEDSAAVWRRPFYLGVAVYSFQRDVYYTRISILPEDTVTSVIEELNAEIAGQGSLYAICSAVPQPMTQRIAVLIDPAWTRMIAKCPILVDAQAIGGHCFGAFCGRDFSLEDVIGIMGNDWKECYIAFAAGIDGRLEQGRLYPALRGMVVSVCGADGSRPPYQYLEQRLLEPQTWSTPAAASGVRDGDEQPAYAALLGDTGGVMVTIFPELAGWSEVKIFVASVLERDAGSIRLTTPVSQPAALSIRGQRISSVFGVADDATAMPYGIFLDARELGADLAFVQQQNCTSTIFAILDELWMQYCRTIPLCVRGAVLYTPATGMVTYGHRTVLTVSVDVKSLHMTSTCVGLRSPGTSDDSGGSRGDGNSPGGCGAGAGQSGSPNRSRSPRREAQTAATTFRTGTGPGDHAAAEPDGRSGRVGSADTEHPDSEAPLRRFGTVLDCISAAQKEAVMSQACKLIDRREGEPVRKPDGCEAERPRPRRIATPCRNSAHKPFSAADLRPTRQVIQLANAVGPMQFDVRHQCLRVMSAANEVALNQLGRPWHGFCLSRDLSAVRIKECTMAALSLCTAPEHMDHFDKVELYTDGSAKDGADGFAVVVIAQATSTTTRNTAFLGYIAGRVELDKAAELYLEATVSDSIQAEVSAVAWAALWALAHRMTAPGALIDFRFDNMLAGMTAAGKWTDQSSALVRKSRQIVQYCEHLWGACGFRWIHTPAHKGHPWNELADAIAGAVMRGDETVVNLPELPVGLRLGEIDFSFANFCGMDRNGSRLRFGEGVLNWGQHRGPALMVTPTQLIPTSPGYETATIAWDIKMVTVNLQSGIDKLHYLEQQFVSNAINIACLQEVKGREGTVRSQAYLRFETNSDGVWGCAIWISRTLPLATCDGGNFLIDERDISVITARPRMLVLKLRTPASWLYLASVHRPAQTRPLEEQVAFAAELEAVLEKVGGHPCIAGMDANGRVPPSFDAVTGDLQCGDADRSGLELVGLLSAHGLWFPSTFSACHEGALETWTHPGGKRSRIDFPVLSHHFTEQDARTWAAAEIDTLNPNDDHDAVGMRVRLVQPCQGRRPPQLDRRRKFDSRKLKEPEVLSKIDGWIDFLQLKDIPWDLDVNVHTQAVQEVMHAVLCHEAPLDVRGP